MVEIAKGKNENALEIRDCEYRFPDAAAESPPVVAIKELTLQAGQQLLITAPSGFGKSTLLYLIAGLLDPVRGRIHVNGQWVHGMSGAARDQFRGKSIGMIFQTFNLLHGFTACENVEAALLFTGAPTHTHRAKAAELLESLGIERIDAMVDALSVGQQQRVAVARAVACDPVLVLADEPTASLDPENAKTAMELIRDTCKMKNAALLCVSHDPSLSAVFDSRLDLRAARSESANRAAQIGPVKS